MESKFFGLFTSATSPTSPPVEQPAEQAPPKRRGRKKLYVVVAAVAAIVIILVAVMFVPQGSADVISLGVHYSVGEKLTYAMTMTLSTNLLNASAKISIDSTVTVEVVSFQDGVYKINYTTTTSSASYSMSTSKVIDVKESEMVTALALLPVALQQEIAGYGNNSSPMLTAFFDQTQAKVGDTWTIPIHSEGSALTEDLTVTFKAIQDLSVEAGNFKVFRIDFSTKMEQSQNAYVSYNLELSGQSYLEQGPCKQIQSTLQMTMSYDQSLGSSSSNFNYDMDISITSKLTKDLKP